MSLWNQQGIGKRTTAAPTYIQPMKLKYHGLLSRYAKLRVVHAPGMPGTFSPPARVSDPDMHHGKCVTHVALCMPWSPSSAFLWSLWWGKCSRHSWRMRIPQFRVSDKRPVQHSYSWIRGSTPKLSPIAIVEETVINFWWHFVWTQYVYWLLMCETQSKPTWMGYVTLIFTKSVKPFCKVSTRLEQISVNIHTHGFGIYLFPKYDTDPL